MTERGAADADGWRQLTPRVLALHVVRLSSALAPIVLLLVLGGSLDRTVVIPAAFLFGGGALRAANDALTWATTRYRVGDERVELRSGLLRRSELSVPRDRVRTVNLTAKPLHRAFAIATVEIGTGSRDQRRLRLDAVPAAEAARLRQALLARSAVAGAAGAAPTAAPALGPGTAGAAPAAAPEQRGVAGAAGAASAAAPEQREVAGAAGAASAAAAEQRATGSAAGAAPTAGAAVGGAASPSGAVAGNVPAGTAVVVASEVDEEGETLARLRWRWLPYHVLSPWTLALPVVGLGALLNALDSFGIQDDVSNFVEGAAVDSVQRADGMPAWLIVLLALIGALGLLLVGAIGAGAQFLESWWGYRLTREPGGTLHVRRGLLTARSISIEQRRLRGIAISEPLLQRAVDGAGVRAIVSGLRAGDEGKAARADALLPNAPRAEADRIAADVLQEPDVPRQLTDLRTHPRTALRRRLLRACAGAAVPVGLLVVFGPLLDVLPSWWWIAGLVLLIPALMLGHDAYRGLGHRIAGRYLVTRHGTFVRRTYALRRDGVIGWNVHRSFFQRRAGLVTLTATTAAGSGGYSVIDVGEHDALALAEDAVPGLLAPFLERSGRSDGA